MIYENFLATFTDYKPITLYWQKLSIAEDYGVAEVKTVFYSIFEEAKTDYKWLTELVMVTNHKCWQHAEITGNSTLYGLYNEFYQKASKYAYSHLKGKEFDYFFQVTD